MATIFPPADPAKLFLEAYQVGARVSEANAALAQRERAAAMELEQQRERLHYQQIMQEQELEMKKAIAREQADLERQQLQQAQAVNQWKMKQAADQVARQTRINQALSAEGLTPEQAGMVYLREGGATPGVASILGTMQRSRASAEVPQSVTASQVLDQSGAAVPGAFQVPSGKGYNRVITGMGLNEQQSREREAALKRRIDWLKYDNTSIQNALRNFPPYEALSPGPMRDRMTPLIERMKANNTELSRLMAPTQAPAQAPGGAEMPQSFEESLAEVRRKYPTPTEEERKDPSKRKKGQVYMINDSFYTWTGKGWDPYEQPAE